MNKYKTILADPPWTYNNKRTGGSMLSGSAQKYPVMSLKEICDLPVAEISDKDSVLFLWSTIPLIEYGFEVMKSWGYQYKTTIVWKKITHLGMGFWFKGRVEVCLFGIKGKIKPFRYQKANFIQSKPGKHFEKPQEFFDLIDPIAPLPKIELFARTKREGWDCWGNEVESDINFKILEGI